jgi:polysaccharide export outer membrane protein
MRLCRFLCLTALALAVAGCARTPSRQVVQQPSGIDAVVYGDRVAPRPVIARTTQYVPVAQPRRAAAPDIGPYTLDSGDKLRIVVFGQDTLSNTYAVDANGNVSMPLIGQVNARGLSTAQLSSAIAGRLKASFIRDPSVAVEIETYRPFFILGEVTYPGQYPYVANMTVETAIAIAGGFTPRATRNTVTLTRKIDGVPAKFTLPTSYPIRPGDTLTVGERWF